jgi:hypothetical protein
VSDHLDAPGLKSPNMDARVDISDISAFQNPADPTRSFLAMSLFTGVRGIRILRTSRQTAGGGTMHPVERLTRY